MSFKKMLAVLLAVCLIVPMAACGKEPDDTTVTTTVNQGAQVTDGNGEAEPTDGEGEETTTGEDTVVTDENGNTVTTEPGATTTVQNGGKTTSTTKSGRTTTSGNITTVSRPNISGYVGGEVTLKKGTVRADKGVDFGGATFLLASGSSGSTPGEFLQEGFDIFKQKYNGNLKMDGLGHEGYTQKVAANQASGKVYDILFLYTPEYPALITADCAIPVTDYITTADLWTGIKEGGFSETVIQDFSWNGQAYAMGGNYMQTLYGVFYNKKIFKDNRMEDPETLVKQGKWTWEKYLEMGQEYVKSNPGKYFMPSLSGWSVAGFIQTYNTDIVVMKNGVMKENTADKQLYKAFEMLQKMHYGTARIADTKSGGDSARNNFLNGTTATIPVAVNWWKDLEDGVQGNSVFGGTSSNLGLVVAPKGNGSSKYGLVNNQSYLAGKGTSNPLAAVCYAMVESTYNTKNAYNTTTPAAYKEAICKVLDSGNLKSTAGDFASSLGKLPTLVMTNEVAKGQNVSTVLSTYKKQIQRILDAACK